MTDVATDTDVLVVGAGPTGLTLAIELRRRGVDCRIVERNDSTVETSRALSVNPRTLQAFEDMGVPDPVLAEGVRIGKQAMYADGRELFRLDLDTVDASPYPFAWFLPQNRTERILSDRLAELGGEVEFERELVDGGELHERYAATCPSLYLLRPDDHVGFRGSPARLDPLLEYLAEWFGPPTPDRGSDLRGSERTNGERGPADAGPSTVHVRDAR